MGHCMCPGCWNGADDQATQYCNDCLSGRHSHRNEEA